MTIRNIISGLVLLVLAAGGLSAIYLGYVADASGWNSSTVTFFRVMAWVPLILVTIAAAAGVYPCQSSANSTQQQDDVGLN